MFRMPSGPKTPNMRPCKECGKSTRSHIIGSEHYCHACWKAFPEEKKDDIVRMQKSREARAAMNLAMAMASVRDTVKKDGVETEQLSDSVTLVKTKKKPVHLLHTIPEETEETEENK